MYGSLGNHLFYLQIETSSLRLNGTSTNFQLTRKVHKRNMFFTFYSLCWLQLHVCARVLCYTSCTIRVLTHSVLHHMVNSKWKGNKFLIINPKDTFSEFIHFKYIISAPIPTNYTYLHNIQSSLEAPLHPSIISMTSSFVVRITDSIPNSSNFVRRKEDLSLNGRNLHQRKASRINGNLTANLKTNGKLP